MRHIVAAQVMSRLGSQSESEQQRTRTRASRPTRARRLVTLVVSALGKSAHPGG
jgi:hypothetical protein